MNKVEKIKAEMRGEEPVSKGCGIEFPFFGANYPDARCCDGYLWDMDSWDEELQGFTIGGDEPCPVCNTEKWLEEVIERDLFDSRKEALEYVEQLKKRYSDNKYNVPKEPVSEDLESEFERVWNKELSGKIDTEAALKIAYHFADWQKQQLMKDAVEASIIDYSDLVKEKGSCLLLPDNLNGFKDGDKVRMIIIKED